MPTAIQTDSAVAKQWERVQAVEISAHEKWDELDREKRKLVKLAKMGRKVVITVPISSTRGVRIKNQFREKGVEKIWAHAAAKKYDFKEVPLSE